jgi:outer membrane lipoprotein-sorting protein
MPALVAAIFMSRAVVAQALPAAENNSLLVSWLAAQPSIQSWSADFVQTRTLKTLVQPLVSSGHVWFAAPNEFRWELGHPPKTIAIRQKRELYVIYPLLKRAEEYPLGETTPGRWRDTLALLDTGFPRSREELQSNYTVLSVTREDGVGRVRLQPKSPSARQMMSEIRIAFSTANFELRSTELVFADGALLRNDFTNTVLNPKLDSALFKPDLGNDYKIVEPLKSLAQ